MLFFLLLVFVTCSISDIGYTEHTHYCKQCSMSESLQIAVEDNNYVPVTCMSHTSL